MSEETVLEPTITTGPEQQHEVPPAPPALEHTFDELTPEMLKYAKKYRFQVPAGVVECKDLEDAAIWDALKLNPAFCNQVVKDFLYERTRNQGFDAWMKSFKDNRARLITR